MIGLLFRDSLGAFLKPRVLVHHVRCPPIFARSQISGNPVVGRVFRSAVTRTGGVVLMLLEEAGFKSSPKWSLLMQRMHLGPKLIRMVETSAMMGFPKDGVPPAWRLACC